MSNLPKKTDENGRDESGRFTDGNKGKPKGATNKTTRDVREFITNFLNDKAFEIPHIWDSLDDKEKATLYLHLCRLVLPKAPDEKPENDKDFKRSVIRFNLDTDLTPTEKHDLLLKIQSDETDTAEFIDLMERMTIDDFRELVKRESLTSEQIDLLIEKL